MNLKDTLVLSGLATLLAGLLPINASAQELEAGPSLTVADTLTGKMKLRSNGQDVGKTSINRFGWGLTQTVGQDLSLGLNFQINQLGLPRDNATVPLPGHLRAISANANYSYVFAPTWTGVAFVSPGWYTATGSGVFTAKGFGVTTGLGVRRQISPTFSVLVGLSYNTLSSHTYRVLPFSGLEWKMSDDWSLTVGYPQIAVTYTAAPDLRLSWVVLGNIGSYYVAKSPLPNLPALDRTKLEYTEIRTGLSAAYSVTKSATVAVSSGMVCYRQFDYHARAVKLTSHGTTPYVTLSCNVSF